MGTVTTLKSFVSKLDKQLKPYGNYTVDNINTTTKDGRVYWEIELLSKDGKKQKTLHVLAIHQ